MNETAPDDTLNKTSTFIFKFVQYATGAEFQNKYIKKIHDVSPSLVSCVACHGNGFYHEQKAL